MNLITGVYMADILHCGTASERKMALVYALQHAVDIRESRHATDQRQVPNSKKYKKTKNLTKQRQARRGQRQLS